MARIIRATALLLLSTGGLLDFARGSFSADGDKVVFSDVDHKVVRGHVEQVKAQALKLKELPSAAADTTTTTWLPSVGQIHHDAPGVNLALLSKTVHASAIDKRSLQESDCADGTTPISVTSTVFPSMEGCLLPVVVEGEVWYTTGVATIFPASASSTDPPFWFAAYEDSLGELTLSCFSVESADDADPSEASWLCDTDGDGSDFILADDEQLSVSCGCSTASPPSPIVTPPPAPSTTVPTCGEGDSFSISSATLPDAEGCYLDTAETNNLITVYSTSGTTDAEQILMIALDLAGDDPSTPADLVWVLVYGASADGSEDNIFYCLSEEDAAVYHPSEVQGWICDEGLAIAVECGCSVSPSPGVPPPTPTASPTSPMFTPPPSPIGTPPPAPSTTVPTCGEGDSFSISSATLPDAEGCYLDTTYVINEVTVYSTSGTVDLGQIWMSPFDLNEEDPSAAPAMIWVLVYVAPTDGSEENNIYCISEEDATLYHPSEVPQWICDEGLTIDVECGCSSSSSPRAPTPTPLPTAQPVASSVSPRTSAPIVPPLAQPTADPTSTPAQSPASDDDEPAVTANTCSGDGSFTITASAAPNLDGCFEDTGFSTGDDGSVFYTVSGTTGNNEIVLSSGEDDSGDFVWSISDNSSGDSKTLCVSTQSASVFNPGNVAWSCDFTGDGDNFQSVTEEDISVICGECAETEAANNVDSSASSLGVAVVTAGGAGMVALASSYASWC